MKVLQILEKLENNPTLVTQSLKEITERNEELLTLERIYKINKSKLLHIINQVPMGASKLVKVVVELRKVLREEFLVKAELAAIQYFKNGSGVESIKRGLKANETKWAEEAVNNYNQMFS